MSEAGAKLILDPCCGSRMFWFDKENPLVIFGDIRRSETTLCDGRVLTIAPDVDLDFTALPYENEQFRLVVFDPPHLDNLGEKSWMAAKYGRLPKDWEPMIAAGFRECLRVLHQHGVLVFKWNESRIPVRRVLALAPLAPLFGHTTGQNGKTHWCVFMKLATENTELQGLGTRAEVSTEIETQGNQIGENNVK